MVANSMEKSEHLHLAGKMKPPVSLLQSVATMDKWIGEMPVELFRPIPLGIEPLDRNFGGGAHPEDVLLILGRQNVGKTILILQMARNMAIWSTQNNYKIVPFVVCYEHNVFTLLTRLLCMESWFVDPENPLRFDEIKRAIVQVKNNAKVTDIRHQYNEMFEYLPKSAFKASMRIAEYAENMIIYHGSRVYTGVEQIGDIMAHHAEREGRYLVPIIDYLQTMAPPNELISRQYKDMGVKDVITSTNLQMLKDLANKRYTPIIAVSAVEKEALVRQGPVHLEDGAGDETTNYAIDCAVVLNRDTAKAENASTAEGRKNDIRMSIEKNRRGPSELEWRHEILGGSFFINPSGREVPLSESYQASRVVSQQKQQKQE